MITSKVEFLVEWGGKQDEIAERTLKHLRSMNGIEKAELKDGSILVESTLPSSILLSKVEQVSGRRAVLQGFGERLSGVVEVRGSGNTVGVVRIQQIEEGLILDGAVSGLESGKHALRVHQAGDLSEGCDSLGEVYGGVGGAGDIGVITADETGYAVFRIINQRLKLSEVIGRSLAITESPPSNGGDVDWGMIKNAGCGIIARSAGALENAKRVCACDGVVVWQERERPAAGAARRRGKPCCGERGG